LGAAHFFRDVDPAHGNARVPTQVIRQWSGLEVFAEQQDFRKAGGESAFLVEGERARDFVAQGGETPVGGRIGGGASGLFRILRLVEPTG